MQHYGWSGFFAVLTMASAFVGLLLMPMMMAGISKRELQSAPPDN